MASAADLICNDIIIPKGTNYSLGVEIFAGNSAYTPERGDVLVLQVKKSVADHEPLIEKRLTDFEDGVVFRFAPEDTADIPSPRRCMETVLWYDIRLYLKGGETVMVIPTSKFVVREVVTWLET